MYRWRLGEVVRVVKSAHRPVFSYFSLLDCILRRDSDGTQSVDRFVQIAKSAKISNIFFPTTRDGVGGEVGKIHSLD